MIQVSTRDLARALAIVAPLSGGAATLPIVYSTHLLPTDDGKLTITTSNLSAWAKVEIPASSLGLDVPSPKDLGVEKGACIASKQLSGLVSTLEAADTQITFPDGNRKAKITSGRVKAEMLCLPGEEFPLPTQGTLGEPLVLPADLLCSALQGALGFASSDSSRVPLMTVLMQGKRSGIAFVGTDTHSLFRRNVASSALGDCAWWGDRMIPSEMVGQILRMTRATKAKEVSLRIVDPESGGGFMLAQIKGELEVTLTLRLVDGAYPNYERVIPTAHEREWTLDRRDALTALSRVAITAADNAGRVIFASGDTPSTITITAESGTVGEIRDEIEVGSSGDPTEFAASGKSMKRALDVMDGDGVTLRMTEPLRPITIIPTDEPKTDGWSIETLAIVMPMQVV